MKLRCTVRGCGAALSRGERAFTCPRGHAYDVSRTGYVNLLQPQDRRSREPGDRSEAVDARVRLHEAGIGRRLIDAVVAAAGAPSAVLDAGCGPGFLLAALPGERYGLDLSVRAIDIAARRHAGPLWIVANADRRLPFADGSLDLVCSITGPKGYAEYARVLASGGRVLLALAAADDLIELREAVLGRGDTRDRTVAAREAFAAYFRETGRTTVRERRRCTPTTARDLLAATYRGLRRGATDRVAALEEMDITFAHDLLELAVR